MRRLLATVLLAGFSLLTVTFAGLSLFGMSMHSGMGDDACVGLHCAPMADGAGTHDMACVNHCLSAASALANAVMPLSPAVGLLAALLFVLFAQIGTSFAPTRSRAYRWREGIGKALRHRQLSTVILRN